MSEILFPYVSVSAQPPADLNLVQGAMLRALIDQVLPESRFVINIKGFLVEATLPYLLKPGDPVQIQVRDSTPQTLLLDVSPLQFDAPQVIEDTHISQLLDRIDLPKSEEAVRVVREFLRQQAPMERATLARAIESAKADPVRAEAAAFLAARGIEPTEEAVTALQRMASPPPPAEAATVPDNPVLREARAAIQRTDTPPIPRIEEAIAQVLHSSPRLRSLDQAIRLVEQSIPQKSTEAPPSPLEVAKRVATLIREIESGRVPEAPLKEPHEVLRELRMRLMKMESQEVAKEPVLVEARTKGRTVFEALDRAQGFRVVNQLFTVHNEGTALVEIPVADGVTVPIRVLMREGGKGTGEPGSVSLTIDTDLSRLGRVRTRLNGKDKNLEVRILVRDEEIRGHLGTGTRELAERLSAKGLQSRIEISVQRLPDEPLHFPSAGGISYTRVDVKA